MTRRIGKNTYTIEHFYLDSTKEGREFINRDDVSPERLERAKIGHQINDKALRAIGYVPIEELEASQTS